MARKSNDDFAILLANELKRYANGIEKEVEKEVKNVSKEMIKEIRKMAPKRTGDYKKGWRLKKLPHGYMAHNTIYRLTHLLEKSHVGRDGKRVEPIKHIKPNEEWAKNELLKRITRIVKK